MVRRFVAGLLTATLTAALLVFGSAGAAQALPSCGVSGFELSVVPEPRMFHYSLRANRDKNNVNIRIYSATNQLVWYWNSPDDRRGGRWYHIQPTVAVPEGGYATFTAIFDVSFGSDPQCTYTTGVCCSSLGGWAPNGVGSGPWGVSPPYMTRLANNVQVQAELNGHSSFVYVVKASGMADAYFYAQGSVFTLNQSVYGGKTVRVSARAEGSSSHPWSFPELYVSVPALPPPPPPPPPPPETSEAAPPPPPPVQTQRPRSPSTRQSRAPEHNVTRTPVTRSPISVAPNRPAQR